LKISFTVLLYVIAALSAPLSQAQQVNFLSRPIKLIVPFAPGAATDISARTISDRVESLLGQPLVIENQGAASGIVGTELVEFHPELTP
jgi:tripartite-type tricarboxylate transporter receptor subunit TctC